MKKTPPYIQAIEDALNDLDGADPDLLRNPKTQYDEECAKLNARLLDIAPYLSRSLRPEAIQLATEFPPDLLDAVWVHDFPGLQRWCDIAKEKWGWEKPPKLRVDLAAQINHCHGCERDLKDLLKEHRRLPLTGGTLEQRIDILQQLIKRDPTATVWEENLEMLQEELSG